MPARVDDHVDLERDLRVLAEAVRWVWTPDRTRGLRVGLTRDLDPGSDDAWPVVIVDGNGWRTMTVLDLSDAVYGRNRMLRALDRQIRDAVLVHPG